MTTIALSGCTSSSIGETNVDTITISYSGEGCWRGTIRDDAGTRSVEGCEDAAYTMRGGHVYAIIAKDASNDDELCMTFLLEGNEVDTTCTTASRGTVSMGE